MRNSLLLLIASTLAACASEAPPRVDAEVVEAAVEQAHLDMESATAPAAKAAPGTAP